jgi:hypothetical protein
MASERSVWFSSRKGTRALTISTFKSTRHSARKIGIRSSAKAARSSLIKPV